MIAIHERRKGRENARGDIEEREPSRGGERGRVRETHSSWHNKPFCNRLYVKSKLSLRSGIRHLFTEAANDLDR